MNKHIIILMIALFVFSCSGENTTNLRLIRHEVGGTLNVMRITVLIDKKSFGILDSAGTLDASLPSGTHEVTIEYFNPYKDRERLRRVRTIIAVGSKTTIRFVTPQTTGESAYSGEWCLTETDITE